MSGPRNVLRLASDLVAYGWRTGRWWVPALTLVLLAAAAVLATTQAVAPTLVYTLF